VWQHENVCRARLQPWRKNIIIHPALQVAEKVDSLQVLVAQAFLPVLDLLHLHSMHSQEWLCYSTFSAACLAAGVLDFQLPHRL
jgi:Flp pilus assembly protein CpaB